MAERKGAAYRVRTSRPAHSHADHTQRTQASNWVPGSYTQTRIGRSGAAVVIEPRTSIATEGPHTGYPVVHTDEPPVQSWNAVTYRQKGWDVYGSPGGGAAGPVRRGTRR